MNEIGLAYELARDLKEVGERGIPTVVGEVLKVQGNCIWLTTSPSATPDMFFGGQVKVLDGDAEGMRCAIVESAGAQIFVTSSWVGKYRPKAGDHVELSGGPLAESTVYLFEPSTSKASNAFQVTVNTLTTKLTLRTLGKRLKGWLTFSKLYDFEVTVEAPKLTGDGNDLASLRDALFDLKVLKEQCEVMIVDYRMQESIGLSGEGDIESAYAMIQRTGSDVAKHAAIVEFTIRQSAG